MIYLAIYGTSLLGSAVSIGRMPFRRMLFALLTVLIFAFVAFRYEVGCDWFGYAGHFEYTRYWDASYALEKREPAYWWLIVQLHAFGFEYPYLNVLMAIPFFLGLVALAKRQPDPLAFLVLAFPVLIINMPMSALRQSAAIGLICFALIAMQDRRLVRFVALVAAAALFHASAIVFLALGPFVKYRLTLASIALSAILVLPGAYFLLSDTVEFYADRYVNTGIDARGAIFRSAMLAMVGGYFLIALKRKYKERFPTDYNVALIGSWVMIGTLAILPFSSVISDRFGYYITPIQLMIMARLPYLVPRGPQGSLIAACPYLALGLVLLVWTANSSHFQQCYLPYQTWLSWKY